MEPIEIYLADRPRPQPRGKMVVKGKARFVVSNTSRVAKEYKARLEAAMRKALAEWGYERPSSAVAMKAEFWFATKVASRWGKLHTPRPDKDNLDKMVMDCAERAGLFVKGDNVVADGHTRKLWSREDGAFIRFDYEPEDGPLIVDDDDDVGAFAA